jgi:toxin YoeB
VRRTERLIEAVLADPFIGIGKPEPLRHEKLKGCWSRRITKEHRLVYLAERGVITFLQCRYHY